jgi:hypothetical protein
VPFPEGDQPGLAQHVEMPRQVAVGERAQPLQLIECHARGTRDERGHDAEPRFLVERALQSIVRKAAVVHSRYFADQST